MTTLHTYWKSLYPDTPIAILDNFLKSIEGYKTTTTTNQPIDWYKDAIVYSVYVDLFNNDFNGLSNKLDYLKDLGVNCIWLLPILSSPMRDAGFDIQDYYTIRPELLNQKDHTNTYFQKFLQKAHQLNIRVIFDFAINHTSDKHPWFVESKKSKTNPYRQYYIWENDDTKYSDARIIFKGIETSNWEKSGEQYYFHRFFNFQPDLNYKNPEVLFGICRALLYWQKMGVDGFRADAIPYLWKEENTDCENLPQTHLVIKFFRAVLDYVQPGTLLLAEACQQPAKVVEYMGNGDECHAAYHFPLMPRIFKSIAMQSGNPIKETLSNNFTPTLPENGQWFTFLRCHDELSLELVYVTEEERKYIHEQYCHKPLWDFRLGEGISARLAELMQGDAKKILLAYSLILTLPGTPVIYYGDEFATLNDEQHYHNTIALTGKDDTRFLVRGKINWKEVEKKLNNPKSLSSKVFYPLKKMLSIRNQYNAFGRGTISFLEFEKDNPSVLIFVRTYKKQKLLIVHNISSKELHFKQEFKPHSLTNLLDSCSKNIIEPYGFCWLLIQNN